MGVASWAEKTAAGHGWKIGCLLLVMAALALRLWGVHWAGDGADPGARQIIDGIADGRPLFHLDPANPVWDQFFFFLAAMFKQGLWLVWAAIATTTGLATSIYEVAIPTVMAGRVLAAMLGAATVFFVWRLTNKLYRLRSGGFIAAAMVAFCPLLMAQGHLLGRGSASALATVPCLLLAVDICRGARHPRYAAAGLAAGLACTVDISLALLLPTFLAAHLVSVLRGHIRGPALVLGQPLVFVVGLTVGLLLGFPALLSGKVSLASAWPQLAAATAPWNGPWVDGDLAGRLQISLDTIGDAIGWEIVALFLVGLGLAANHRHRPTLIVASFPLVYWLGRLFWLGGPSADAHAALVPALATVAALGPALLAQRVSRLATARGLAVLALTALIVLPSAWRSAALGYLFWQDQTSESAAVWAGDNIPAGAIVYHGPAIPDAPHCQNRPLSALAPGDASEQGAYIILSALEEDRHFRPWTGRAYDAAGDANLLITGNLQLLKVFDLKDLPPDAQRPGRRRFPEALSPTARVYGNRPASPIVQPLGLQRPPAQARRPHNVCYLNNPEYSKDDTVADLPQGGSAIRALRPPGALDQINVEVVNFGDAPAMVRLGQGPDSVVAQVMEPGQVWRARRPAKNWPPTVPRVYPLKLWAQPGARVAARVLVDPLILGRLALEGLRWSEAEEFLRRAVAQNPRAIVPTALLAAALSQNGHGAQATELLRGREQDLKMLSRLALDNSTPLETWLREASRWSGHQPELLLRAQSKFYAVEMHKGQASGAVVSYATPEFAAEMSWPDGETGPTTRVRINDRLPAAPLLLRCYVIGPPGHIKGEGVAAVLKMVRHRGSSQETAARVAVTDAQLADTPHVVELAVTPKSPADQWEIKLETMRPAPITIGQAQVIVDPRGQLRRDALWAMLAWGQSLTSEGRLPMARRALDDMALIDRNFMPGLVPHAEALMAGGAPEEAARRLEEGLALLADRPKELRMARELARRVGDQRLGGLLADRLTELTPPDQTAIRFEDGVTLAGYVAEKLGDDNGRRVRLRLHWWFEGRPARDYRIAARLEGPRKLDLGHKLQGGGRRMDHTLPGDMIVDEITADLPADAPAGLYGLVLSLDENIKNGRSLMVKSGNMAGRRQLKLPALRLP